jgi:16S rRNA (guanine966-N2)-methyltransferase
MNPSPRIIGGLWRGKKLLAPEGETTRPTSARARQAAFDILLHAPWGGAAWLQNTSVLDVFAGTGAFGLEALSRGAAFASFIEISRPALDAIKSNITSCKAENVTRIIRADALHPPAGTPHGLVFMDPPYGQNFVPAALAALRQTGWIAPDAVIVAELGPGDDFMPKDILTERKHGKARLVFFRETSGAS